MGGFFGTAVPVWDAASVYKDHPDDKQDMLVKILKLASALGRSLGDGAQSVPKHPVALMRGHGSVATSNSRETVVFNSVYTAQKCQSPTTATQSWH